MILLIDNYDSFTFNLAQYLGELGAPPVVRRNDEISLDDIGELHPGHIVISPGPGRPEDAGISVDLIRRFGPTTPVLGVCLGHQSIGVAFGGQVVRASQLMHGKTKTARSTKAIPKSCREKVMVDAAVVLQRGDDGECHQRVVCKEPRRRGSLASSDEIPYDWIG